MELRPDRLERQLASEPLRPVYLVAGAEPLLVQEAADAVRARAREEGYGERQVLDADRMEQLVADSSRFDVFRLADAAFAGEVTRVVRMLAALRAEGEQVAGLMPMIAKEVVSLASIARAAERGGGVAAAMRAAHVWESKQAVYRRALERHPVSRWEAFAAECGRVDRTAKGRGDGDPWLLLERLLVAIADAKARRLLAS